MSITSRATIIEMFFFYFLQHRSHAQHLFHLHHIFRTFVVNSTRPGKYFWEVNPYSRLRIWCSILQTLGSINSGLVIIKYWTVTNNIYFFYSFFKFLGNFFCFFFLCWTTIISAQFKKKNRKRKKKHLKHAELNSKTEKVKFGLKMSARRKLAKDFKSQKLRSWIC